MTPFLPMFEKLIKNKSVEVSSGVELRCGSEVNLKIFEEDDNVIIKFGSPAVQVFVTKMGPLKLLNAVRPTVERITITNKSFIIKIDNGPDIEVSREQMVS